MVVYIFKITSFDANGKIDYSVVDSVYSKRDDAKKVATSRVKAQKSLWQESYVLRGGKGKVTLMISERMRQESDCMKKEYQIMEMEVK